ncbi:MAG TPA: hypothetical protein VMF31_00640 [Solirubrobacterales bacterium]|nr:hypothetical protein [Solirubrobacterales bacterium]
MSSAFLLVALVLLVMALVGFLTWHYLRRRAHQRLFITTRLSEGEFVANFVRAIQWTGWRSEKEPGVAWGQSVDPDLSIICDSLPDGSFCIRTTWPGNPTAYPKNPFPLLLRRWRVVRRLKKRDRGIQIVRKNTYTQRYNERSALE